MSLSNIAERSTAWWNAAKDCKHETLSNWTHYVAQQTMVQRMDTRIFVEVISNFNPTGNGDFSYQMRSMLPHKIRDNIIQAGSDTVVSMVAQARTSPQYLTTAAEWSLSRIAEKRSRGLQGLMYDLKCFKLLPRCFRDACEGGTGYVVGKVVKDKDGKPRPHLERALHNEVYVDPEDGRYGDPKRAARVSFEDRDDLIAEHPEKKAQILAAAGPTSQDYIDFFIQRNTKADRVRVVEGWCKPTKEGASDGVYVKAISNCTLVEKPFKRRRIPIVRVLYAERTQGYYGQSLTERMLPAQLRLSETDENITQLQRLVSGSKWYTFRNSGVEQDDITNANGQVIEVSEPGLMPQQVTYSGTPPDLASQRQEIKSDVYDQEGLSQNAMTGDVNKGLSSGRSIRAADDQMVRRFISPARLLEDAYLETVRLIEDLCDECAEIDPKFALTGRYRSGKRTWLKSSTWLELSLPEHDAAVQMFPISAQATTPQGKWSSVEEWVQAGFVSKPQAMDLMEFPDPSAFETLENANLDLIHEQIDNIIDLEGARMEMLLPIPNQDLLMAAKIVNDASMVAFRLKAPDEVMARFDAYAAYLQDLQNRAAANQNAPVDTGGIAPAALDQSAAAAAQLAAAQPVPGAGAPMIAA